LARHARLELVEVREDEQVGRRMPERAFVSLLHREGERMDSIGFSRFLEERRRSGRDLCFVIGGPYGLDLADVDHRFPLGEIVVLIVVGTVGFSISEGSSLAYGFVRTLDTITTLGSIPDPTDTAGRTVRVALELFGIGTLFYGLATVAEFFVSGQLSGV